MIVNGFLQERLSQKDQIVKVCNFFEATVEVMGRHIIHNISKKPSNIILHVEKNNFKNSTSREILDSTLKLKSFIRERANRTVKYSLSIPRLRTDHVKTSLTVSKLAKNIMQLKLDVADDNINSRNLRITLKFTRK